MHLPLSGTLEHVSVGCNRIVGALSWSDTDVIAYAAHNAIIVANPNSSQVLATLLGHTDIVNCVHWFPSSTHPQATTNTYSAVLASGSADKTIKIWLWSPSSSASSSSWSCAATLQGSDHSAPITSITLHHDPSRNVILLISTSGDSSVCIWQHNNNNSNTFASWHLRQKLQLSRQETALCAAISSPPPSTNTDTHDNNRDSWLILALGCIDGNVSLWIAAPHHQGQEGEGGGFKRACKLQGHQDWIRGLDFIHVPSDTAAAATDNNNNNHNNSDSTTSHGPRLLLASASQDKYVRVWSIRREEPPVSSLPAAAGVAESSSNSNGILAYLSKYAPRPVFDADGMCSAVLEALLIGHEDWVHSVQWKPQRGGGGGTKKPCLLSSSMDRTMMLWEPDVATGLWMATSSLGDAGANHLGYYTATFSPTGTGLVAHGYTGALHLWKKRQDHAAAADNDDDDDLPWVPQPAPGGHFGPVVSLCWAADNHCVLSVSTDQTARMLTQMKKRWCEIARPQVHGHDFYGVAALQNLRSQGKELTEGYYFASASEEKVIRVFQAPRAFEESLALATGLPLAVHTSSKSIQGSTNGHHNNNQNQNQATALGASLPALGLSNKAVYNELTAEQQKTNNGDFESYQGPDFAPFSTPGVVSEPPVEEHLAQSTLWPEIHKLYGHGNEVFCLSGDPLGRWIASASKAQSVATAGIRLWDTDTWSVAPGKPLEAHTLTVTQLAFSPNGKYLASCSRDRSVAVFVRTKEHVEVSDNNGASYSSTTAAPFTLGWKGSKAHNRIVWSVHWSPDSLFLASSSRDGVIKIWSAASVGEGVGVEMKEVGSVSLGDSVRSVAFAPRNNNSSSSGSSYSLAVGLEGGDIKLFTVGIIRDGDSSGCVLEEVWQTSVETKHAAAVRMLAWRSRGEEDDGAEMLLASSGDDHAVRIYRF